MFKSSFIAFIAALCMLNSALPVTAIAQVNPIVIPLWEKGAPGFENRRNEPEQARDYWVKNINNPSLTVYLPTKEKATGANARILRQQINDYGN